MVQTELVALEGPLLGDRIELPQSGSLIIGRSKRGLHLQDAQVSLEHAEITRTGGRFAIMDLGSVAGTYVNDKKLGRDAVTIHVGSVIRIGDSVFRVEQPRQSRAWMGGVVVVVGVVVGVVGWIGKQLAAPVTYAPVLQWHEPIAQPGGVSAPIVPIPISFVRTEGLDGTNIVVHRVTDYDADGISELWLLSPTEELVVVQQPGAWNVIGRLPHGCLDRPGGKFPDLRCGTGDVWLFRHGAYSLATSDGITVWLDWQPPPDKEGTVPDKPLSHTPFRIGLADPEPLNGFLTVRGVEEPVHYLICEGFLPGIAAQVLTVSGRLDALDYGCIRELGIAGKGDLAGEVPLAVAFTGTGRRALLDDLREFMSGSPDGLFLDPGAQALLDQLSRDPLQRVTHRATFKGAGLPGAGAPKEEPVPGRRTLIPGSTGTAAPYAEVVTVAESKATIDPPGCSKLEVSVPTWFCVLTKGCWPNSTAVDVTEVGCGAPTPLTSLDYRGGIASGRNENIEVRLSADAHGGSGRVDLMRVRLGWREIPPPTP